jgi:hypothetical protein
VRPVLCAAGSLTGSSNEGGVYGHAEEPGSPQLTIEEMQAGVEEAHKASRKVAPTPTRSRRYRTPWTRA